MLWRIVNKAGTKNSMVWRVVNTRGEVLFDWCETGRMYVCAMAACSGGLVGDVGGENSRFQSFWVVLVLFCGVVDLGML